MTEEKITEIGFQLTAQLAALNTNMQQVLNTLSKHDERIRKLELNPSYAVVNSESKEDDSLKNELLRILAKGILIGLITIATLTGASGLIQKIVGN